MWRNKLLSWAKVMKSSGIMMTDKLSHRQLMQTRLRRLMPRRFNDVSGSSADLSPNAWAVTTPSGPGPRRRPLLSPVRVVTDIDDTVKSSGGVSILGVSLGGVDKRLRRGQFYPGGVQFSYEISTYGGPFVATVIPASVAVLTARARELKFALALRPAGKLCSVYRNTGSRLGHPQWGVGHVYYGSVVEWLFQNRKGIRKFQNFEKLAEEDLAAGRKFQYVLIGDTGERDEDAAERIIGKYRKQVKAVFLHAVSGSSAEDIPADRVLEGVSIFYFRTYIGAAVKALHHGLLDKDGLARVADQSNKEIQAILSHPVSPFRSKATKQKRLMLQSELEKDISLAQQILKRM